jgi:hypothetical protein
LSAVAVVVPEHKQKQQLHFHALGSRRSPNPDHRSTFAVFFFLSFFLAPLQQHQDRAALAGSRRDKQQRRLTLTRRSDKQ